MSAAATLLALLMACSAVVVARDPAGASKGGSPRLVASAAPEFRAQPDRSDLRVPAASGPGIAVPAGEAAPREPFAMDLYQAGDFVAQHTFEWCVAASVQMAWNMVQTDVRSSRADQQQLWEMARDRSNNPYRGADPGGWTQLLNELGLGPYELVSIPKYDGALAVAAQALRDTGRPVGLVMWRGRHAWIMSGFESLGDPAANGDFQVTGIRVADPLYPYGSGTWGPSPEPNALLSPEQLAEQFVFREQRRWSSHIPAGFLLVLPVIPDPEAKPRTVLGGPGWLARYGALEAQ